MQNALLLIQLLLQNATQLQGYATAVQKALAEGRDVTADELAVARGALQSHLDGLQGLIDSMK